MDTTTAKKQLTSWINDLEDENMLSDLLAIKDDQRKPLYWDELPQQAQDSALRGLYDLQAGRVYSSKQMWSEINRRRKQRLDGTV